MSKRGSGSSARAGGGFKREGVTATYSDGTTTTIMKTKGTDGQNMYFSKDQFGNYKEIESMHGANMSVSQIAENAKKRGGKVTILKESDFKKEDSITQADRDYKNKHQIDYSLGLGLGPGGSIDKAHRKRARLNRLTGRRK